MVALVTMVELRWHEPRDRDGKYSFRKKNTSSCGTHSCWEIESKMKDINYT